MKAATADKLCANVVKYQRNRMTEIINSDDLTEFKELIGDGALEPSYIFSPYFYTADEWRMEGIEANADFAKRSVKHHPDLPIHQLLMISPGTLQDRTALESIVASVKESGVKGVWIWVSKFNELYAPFEGLVRMRALVTELAQHAEVYTYAGGLWSMLLGEDGLTAVAHGVGYGEGRDAVSPVGTAAPMVRYYLPPVGKRLGVPDIEVCFKAMMINNADDFHRNICDCRICKGVLRGDLNNFRSFGDMHRSVGASRDAQTPTAAKLCRFHFLLHRLGEDREFVKATDPSDRSAAVLSRARKWPVQPTIRRECGHIEFWASSLSPDKLSLDDAFAGQ